MAYQYNLSIQCHSRWFTLENTGQMTSPRQVYRQYTN